MYQPDCLNDLINQARLNGHRDIVNKLVTVQNEMMLHNYIEQASDNVRLGWRGKCETELTLEDLI